MSKLHNLPGIDTGPEVYETPDVDESEEPSFQINYDDISESKDIDNTKLAPTAAFEVFAGKRFSTAAIDYSDSLTSKRTHRRVGTLAGQTDYAIKLDETRRDATTEGKPKESILQRYTRLQFEVNELLEELKSASEQNKHVIEQGVKTTELTDEVKALRDQLEQLKQPENSALRVFLDPAFAVSSTLQTQDTLAQKLIAEIKHFKELGNYEGANKANTQTQNAAVATTTATDSKLSTKTITYELYYHPEQAKFEMMAKYADLEKRIAALEKFIGVNIFSSPNKTISEGIDLQTTVSKMEQKLSMLDDQKMEALHRKLKALNFDLEKIINKKQSINTTDLQKVDELFETVQKWESVVNQIPLLISRLKTLKGLHDDGLAFADTVKRMDKQQSELSEILTSQNALLTKMEQSFGQNLVTIESNITLLDERMKVLSEKLKHIQL